jgi:hypothetical protein
MLLGFCGRAIDGLDGICPNGGRFRVKDVGLYTPDEQWMCIAKAVSLLDLPFALDASLCIFTMALPLLDLSAGEFSSTVSALRGMMRSLW